MSSINTSSFMPQGGNAVFAAQAQSRQEAEDAAEVAKSNAADFAKLTAAGITVTTVSFVDQYKSQILKAVDTDGSQTISQAELDKQVLAGNGTEAQSVALFKAMDENGDGTVSAQEFKDSLPDPFATAGFDQKLQQLLTQIKAGQAAPDRLLSFYAEQGAAVDTGQLLGQLAQNFPKT